MSFEGEFRKQKLGWDRLRQLIGEDGLTAAQITSLLTLANTELDKIENLSALSDDQITALVGLSTTELGFVEGAVAGVPAANKAVVANAAMVANQVRAGKHTVTAGEETAGTLAIVTGLTSGITLSVMILRAGNVVTADADVTEAAGTLTVADGATYSVTENDVIHWIAVGTL